MRRVGIVHQRALRQTRSAPAVPVPGDAVNRPEIRRWVALIIVRHRPVAGDDHPAAGADEGAHQTVEREVAAAGQARFRVAATAGPAGRVAGRQDDQVGVELQVENLAEGQQAVRTRRRRSWSASAGRAGHSGRGAVTRPWVAKWRMRILVEIVALP